jgi:hypothetical protein
MTNKVIKRADIPQYYEGMMQTESHHDHEVVRINGVIRWKENPAVNDLIEKIPFNELCSLLNALGHGKNSEIFRQLYRDIGYSLNGYWEIFYWDINNPNSELYKQPISSME